MKPGTRLWLLEGFVAVKAALAALLGSAPPQVDKLLEIVGGVPFKLWYRGGAYCEAVMNTTRRFQFRALYGDKEGDKLWRVWYTSCKSRAGARRRPPRRTPSALAASRGQR